MNRAMQMAFPVATDRVGRVPNLEKVLQALIPYMARTTPDLIDHYPDRFVEPMRLTQREHDHRETDDYAEKFTRAVTLREEVFAPKAKEPEMTGKHAAPPRGEGVRDSSMDTPVQHSRVQVRERNGIWEVRVDGKFRGDYHQKEHALAAAALHKVSLT